MQTFFITIRVYIFNETPRLLLKWLLCSIWSSYLYQSGNYDKEYLYVSREAPLIDME